MNEDSSHLQSFIKSAFPQIIKRINAPSPVGLSIMSKLYDMTLKARNSYSINLKNMRESELTLLDASEPHNIDNYIPPEIILHIKSVKKYHKTFTFLHNGKTCNVYFYYPIYPNDPISKTKAHNFFHQAVYKIYLWLYISDHFANKSCSHTLNLKFYFTNLKKRLPNRRHSPLDTIHVNTAFTYGCTPVNEINLFRKEEWFKVFIHETFHSLGFDFCNSNFAAVDQALGTTFSVKTDFKIYETYCETWAETMYFLFLSFFTTNSKDAALDKFGKILRLETCYSMFQCSKVLGHSALSYSRVIDTSKSAPKYSELSPVFSYYVVKSLVLFSWNDFIQWCHTNNSNIFQFKNSQASAVKFVELIGKLSRNAEYSECISLMERASGVQDDFIRTNTRMTMYEY
jgi:hypothetical protein